MRTLLLTEGMQWYFYWQYFTDGVWWWWWYVALVWQNLIAFFPIHFWLIIYTIHKCNNYIYSMGLLCVFPNLSVHWWRAVLGLSLLIAVVWFNSANTIPTEQELNREMNSVAVREVAPLPRILSQELRDNIPHLSVLICSPNFYIIGFTVKRHAVINFLYAVSYDWVPFWQLSSSTTKIALLHTSW